MFMVLVTTHAQNHVSSIQYIDAHEIKMVENHGGDQSDGRGDGLSI